MDLLEISRDIGNKMSKSRAYLVEIENDFVKYNRPRPQHKDIPPAVDTLLYVIHEIETRLPIPDESRIKLGQALPGEVDKLLFERQRIQSTIWPTEKSRLPESQMVSTIADMMEVINKVKHQIWIGQSEEYNFNQVPSHLKMRLDVGREAEKNQEEFKEILNGISVLIDVNKPIPKNYRDLLKIVADLKDEARKQRSNLDLKSSLEHDGDDEKEVSQPPMNMAADGPSEDTCDIHESTIIKLREEVSSKDEIIELYKADQLKSNTQIRELRSDLEALETVKAELNHTAREAVAAKDAFKRNQDNKLLALKTELTDEMTRLLSEKTRHIMDLEQKNAELVNKVSALEESCEMHEKAVRELNNRNQEKIDKAVAYTLSQAEIERKTFEAGYKSKMEMERSSHKDKIEEIHRCLESEREQNRKDSVKLESQILMWQKKHAESIAEAKQESKRLREEHVNTIEQLRARNGEKLSVRDREHSSIIKKLQDKFESRDKGSKGEISSLKAAIEDARSQALQTGIQHQQAMAEQKKLQKQAIDQLNLGHEKDLDKLHQSLERLKKLYQKDLEEKEGQHERAKDQLIVSHRKELERLNQSLERSKLEQQKTLADKEAKYQQATNQLISSQESELEQVNQSLEKTKKGHQKALAEKEKLHQQAMTQLLLVHQNELKELQQALNEEDNVRKLALDKQKAQHQEALEKIQTEHTLAIRDLKSQHKKILQEAEQRHEARKRELATVNANLHRRDGHVGLEDNEILDGRKPKDGQIEVRGLGQLAREIQKFSGWSWRKDRSAWPDDVMLTLTGTKQIRLKKLILGDLIWTTLFHLVFCTPFRLLGEVSKKIESDWNKAFGQGSSGSDEYKWPTATWDSEKWRYDQCQSALDSIMKPTPELTKNGRLRKSFSEYRGPMLDKFLEAIETLVELDEDKEEQIEKLMRDAVRMWLVFGTQRYRLYMTLLGSYELDQLKKMNLAKENRLMFNIMPKLQRFGKVDGLELQEVSVVDGCEGKVESTKE